jgi:hypothetical protein
MSIHTTTQEAVMSKSVPVQHPAVVLRSQYRNLRSLVAVLLVVVAALSATVAVIAIDGDGTTTSTSSVATGRSYPTLDDPFQARAQPARPQSRPDESAIASSISQAGSRSYPTLNDPFQSQVEQPRPLGGPDESAVATAISPQTGVAAPDESKIAAAIAEHADTGPQARARAWQQKLDSMTPQQEAEAFVEGH